MILILFRVIEKSIITSIYDLLLKWDQYEQRNPASEIKLKHGEYIERAGRNCD